jgi:hypothetical protein
MLLPPTEINDRFGAVQYSTLLQDGRRLGLCVLAAGVAGWTSSRHLRGSVWRAAGAEKREHSGDELLYASAVDTVADRDGV